MAGFTGRKEAPDFDDLSTTLLHLARQKCQQFAERGVRECTRHPPILEQSLEVEVFNANDPVTVRKSGGHFVEDIIAHAGNAVVEACHLTPRLFAIFRSWFSP